MPNNKGIFSTLRNKGVTKQYPHIPEIDTVGIIVKSKAQQFTIDVELIATSCHLEMNPYGGIGELMVLKTLHCDHMAGLILDIQSNKTEYQPWLQP